MEYLEELAKFLHLDSDYSWTELSTCQGVPDDLKEWFFSIYETDSVSAQQVDELCMHCPVVKECAMTALKNKEHGVWGGIYWDGTGKPDKKKNMHKDEETWERVREVLS